MHMQNRDIRTDFPAGIGPAFPSPFRWLIEAITSFPFSEGYPVPHRLPPARVNSHALSKAIGAGHNPQDGNAES